MNVRVWWIMMRYLGIGTIITTNSSTTTSVGYSHRVDHRVNHVLFEHCERAIGVANYARGAPRWLLHYFIPLDGSRCEFYSRGRFLRYHLDEENGARCHHEVVNGPSLCSRHGLLLFVDSWVWRVEGVSWKRWRVGPGGESVVGRGVDLYKLIN